jgi:hypothetical protein
MEGDIMIYSTVAFEDCRKFNNMMFESVEYIPYGLLSEAVEKEKSSIKTRMIAAIKWIVRQIHALDTAFYTKMQELLGRDKAIINGNVDLTKIKDIDEFILYPYWKANMSKVEQPKINIKDTKMFAALKNTGGFIKEYYHSIMGRDGTVSGIKTVLRGSEEKITFKGKDIKSVVRNMQDFLKNYDKAADDIKRDNAEIERTLQKVQHDLEMERLKINNESVSLDDIIIKKYLYEADSVETQPNPPAQDTNNQADVPPANSNDNSDELKAYNIWARACYSVNAIRMNILEETYTEYIKIIAKITK